jgi:hypothetical protein
MTVFVKSEDIANEIVRRLSEIRIANDCETDIGRDVQRGRRRIPVDDEPPCIQLVEGGDDVVDTAGRTLTAQIKVQQTYVIDAFDQCDPANPNTQAHKMIRDLKRAIFKGGRTLGGTVAEVDYLGKDIGPRPDGAALVQARIAIRVSFAEDLANP